MAATRIASSKPGEGEQHVGDAGDDEVDFTADIPGRQPKRYSEHDVEQLDVDGNQQRHPQTVDQPRQRIPPEVVRAEGVRSESAVS